MIHSHELILGPRIPDRRSEGADEDVCFECWSNGFQVFEIINLLPDKTLLLQMIDLSSGDGMDLKIIVIFQTIEKMRSDQTGCPD